MGLDVNGDNFAFVDCVTQLLNDIDDAKNGNKDMGNSTDLTFSLDLSTETPLDPLYELVKGCVGGCMEAGSQGTVIIDDVSFLCDLGVSIAQVLLFIRKLSSLCKVSKFASSNIENFKLYCI